MIVRPSGTEAKMKCYIEVIAKDEAMASGLLNQLRQPIKEFLA
jgi:phosphomannomutase